MRSPGENSIKAHFGALDAKLHSGGPSPILEEGKIPMTVQKSPGIGETPKEEVPKTSSIWKQWKPLATKG